MGRSRIRRHGLGSRIGLRSHAGPLFSTAGGQPRLIFDENGERGLTTAPLALFTGGSSGLTVIAVIKPTDVIQQRFLLMHATGNCTTNFELGVSTGSGGDGNWGLHRGCGDAVVTPNATLVAGQPVIVVTRVATSGTNPNQVTFRVNGVAPVSQQNGGGWLNAGSYSTSSDRLRIGWRDDTGAGANPNSFFQGEVSEILTFDRPLSDVRLSEIEQHLDDKWRAGGFVPGTVGQLGATATQSGATIAWTAADGRGSTITGYDVTVSAGSTTVATCALRGLPPTTSCTVGGLSASTTYAVSVSATNSFGMGAVTASAFATQAPPPPPVLPDAAGAPLPRGLDELVARPVPTSSPPPPATTEAPTPTSTPVPSVPADNQAPPATPSPLPVQPAPPGAGFIEAELDGTPVGVELLQVATDQWAVSGAGFRLDLRLQGIGSGGGGDADGAGVITLQTGGDVVTSGEGFLPGSLVDVWLFSEPRLLARLSVDGTGRFEGLLPVPGDLDVGEHTLQVNGLTTVGLRRSLSLGVLVTQATAPLAAPELPSTGWTPGAAVAWAGLLAVLGLVVLAGRRAARRP